MPPTVSTAASTRTSARESHRTEGRTFTALAGATSDIGWAIAAALTGAGATALASGRRTERLTDLSRTLADAPGAVECLAADLTDPAFVAELVDSARMVDVLINETLVRGYTLGCIRSGWMARLMPER